MNQREPGNIADETCLPMPCIITSLNTTAEFITFWNKRVRIHFNICPSLHKKQCPLIYPFFYIVDPSSIETDKYHLRKGSSPLVTGDHRIIVIA